MFKENKKEHAFFGQSAQLIKLCISLDLPREEKLSYPSNHLVKNDKTILNRK